MAGVRARLLSISRSKSPFYDVDERETGFNERDEQQLRMFSSAAAPSKADGSASETAPLLPHPKRWKNLGTQEFMQYYDRTRSRRMFFRAVLFRDIAIFINVLIGLGLMFCLLELDHRHHVMVNNSRAAKGIEIALSVSTFILIVQTLEYHRLILHTKIRELKRAKNKKIKKKSYIPIIKKKAPIWWTVWVNSSLRYKIFIELIFIVPHPILGFPIWLIKFTSIYMFLRLYVVCRIARDLNPMWRNAALIRRIPGYSTSPVPNVTTMRSLVIYFYQYPILITLITGALICMWSGYGIYVYERDYSDTCDYKTALFLATTSMLTAWPADVFGIYTPGTAGGRSLAIIASVLGLFVFAFLVDHFHSNLRPSQFEVGVVDWVERLKLEDQERVEAAKLVQMVWRRYLQMKRKGKTFFWKKSFRVDFNKQVALLRHIRAEKMALILRTGVNIHSLEEQNYEKAKQKKSRKKLKKKLIGSLSSPNSTTGTSSTASRGEKAKELASPPCSPAVRPYGEAATLTGDSATKAYIDEAVAKMQHELLRQVAVLLERQKQELMQHFKSEDVGRGI